jgi:hypothetical protein
MLTIVKPEPKTYQPLRALIVEDLGGQAKAAIRGHLKTGHREKP